MEKQSSRTCKVALHHTHRKRMKRPRASATATWLLLIAVLLCYWPTTTNAWRQWEWTGPGPGARRGHSLHLFKNQLVIFGGRGYDTRIAHVPKTYEIVEVNGNLEFSTYEDKLLTPQSEECADVDSDWNETVQAECDEEYTVPVGTYFNDLWAYDLSCERYSDEACVSKGWTQIDPGARLGGCYIELGEELCSHPSERYGHSAQIVRDEFLVLFGGFSTFCEDFCDDLWMYTFVQEDASLDPTVNAQLAANAGVWVRKIPIEGASSPGKLWRASAVLMDTQIYLFGGHRLWHGFAAENSEDNQYSDVSTLPDGGYLNELWKLNLSLCVAGSGSNSFTGGPIADLQRRRAVYDACLPVWTMVEPQKNCTSKSLFPDGSLRPGFAWEDRFEQMCVTLWPSGRAGHSLVVAGTDLWLHGGYRTFFPYPNTQSSGAGAGTQTGTRTAASYSPYPSYPYYLDDLWRYDTRAESGYWHRVIPQSPSVPTKRMEHSMVFTRDVIVLFGGYHANYHMNDMWLYNVTANYWLQKKHFVHALYGSNCTEDGVVLAYPTRDTVVDGLYGRAAHHFSINYTRNQGPGWDGCRDRSDGRTELPWELQWLAPSQRSHHAAIYSEAHHALVVHGGHGYVREEAEQVISTPDANVRDDMWVLDMDLCPQNCTNKGDCHFGHCYCNDGFYGVDCSNTTCPGTFCEYDQLTHEQQCTHCCSAPYMHTDADMYITDLAKIPCSAVLQGESNGICDGHGTCQCRPPFIGDDCSMRDCPSDCSDNGWCSVEYPVSRCICNPGYSGHDCSYVECLNNCTYPHGLCVAGECECQPIYDPYNRTIIWRNYQGMDCSYVTPYAAATRTAALSSLVIGLVLAGVLSLVIDSSAIN